VTELVLQNREALVQTLARFGELNRIDPDTTGLSYDRWHQSLPLSAFRGGAE